MNQNNTENVADSSPLERIVMPFYYVNEQLPEDGEYVLIHLTKDNWSDSDDKHGKRYWRVAKFAKGITEEEREKMKNGEMPDGVEIGYTFKTPPGKWVEHKSKRSSTYKEGDVHGNNLVPYSWEEFGPSSYFGQEVDIWARLPIL